MNNVEKIRRALTAIATAHHGASFQSIIESDRECFRGLHVTYATRATTLDIQDIQLDKIESECPLLKSFFDGTGLLFYTDEIYQQSLNGKAPIKIDFSISLDKNVTDAVRLFVEGKQPSQPQNLYKLLKLACGRGARSFNFDYFAYLSEEFEHFSVEGNNRPVQTLRALKKLDHFAPGALDESPGKPIFTVSEDEIDSIVQDTLKTVVFAEPMRYLQTRRLATYLVLLKAALLNWHGQQREPVQALEELVMFSLETLGKFPKAEIYFAWKLLGGAGEVPLFFTPVTQPTMKSLERLRSMSWDLTLFRMAELLSATPRTIGTGHADFFVPFVASYDGKFREMVDACPLQAIVIDYTFKAVNLVFRDEFPFQRDLSTASERVMRKLNDHQASARRLHSDLDHQQLEREVRTLEQEALAHLATR
ncbi:hypothetical protein KDW23_26950 [Burkholderia cenocepacia]|uniref:hypothetical protein n=1 Tax=Burkholderia cenocepacia TaxID=95486 RepID=UPI001BA0D4F7|nr:hypothetical protein [Burkholderia cenocepacia]MBR8070943.1 hypothetical protein [Burkholderia cenocepacia]MBR8448364.1 hypothetical protein [Burkholderia cenocepacia]